MGAWSLHDFQGVRDFSSFISCEKGIDEQETLVIARVGVE